LHSSWSVELALNAQSLATPWKPAFFQCSGRHRFARSCCSALQSWSRHLPHGQPTSLKSRLTSSASSCSRLSDSPSASATKSRARQWVAAQSLPTCRLTPQSRGRPQAGFAHLRPPLTSNVRPPQGRSTVVVQGSSSSAPVAISSTRCVQRWSQQASRAAATATASGLVPSFTTHQACAAGPNKSGLPHTPTARVLCTGLPPRQVLEFNRFRCLGSLRRGQGQVGVVSGLFLPSLQACAGSHFRPCSLVASARLPAPNAQRAKPAEIHWLSFGRHPFLRQRPNPSVKGTSRRRAAPYLER
jgi:hypothetical protein